MKRITRDDTEHGVEYYRADEVDSLLAEQPAQQEPVAWMKPHPKCDSACLFQCTKGFTQFPECATSPPAQPQQEPVAFEEWLAKQHGDPEEIGFLQALRIAYIAGQDSITSPPAQQEPVAWYRDEDGIRMYYDTKYWADSTPLYTSPPAQRTWIGLTDEELDAIYSANGGTRTRRQIYQAIEAKLKEKNT